MCQNHYQEDLPPVVAYLGLQTPYETSRESWQEQQDQQEEGKQLDAPNSQKYQDTPSHQSLLCQTAQICDLKGCRTPIPCTEQDIQQRCTSPCEVTVQPSCPSGCAHMQQIQTL